MTVLISSRSQSRGGSVAWLVGHISYHEYHAHSIGTGSRLDTARSDRVFGNLRDSQAMAQEQSATLSRMLGGIIVRLTGTHDGDSGQA